MRDSSRWAASDESIPFPGVLGQGQAACTALASKAPSAEAVDLGFSLNFSVLLHDESWSGQTFVT